MDESPTETAPPGDLIRYSQSALSAEQRTALARLLDEIAFGIAIVARTEREHGGEPGVQRGAKVQCWESVAEEYARLVAGWGRQ